MFLICHNFIILFILSSFDLHKFSVTSIILLLILTPKIFQPEQILDLSYYKYQYPSLFQYEEFQFYLDLFWVQKQILKLQTRIMHFYIISYSYSQ